MRKIQLGHATYSALFYALSSCVISAFVGYVALVFVQAPARSSFGPTEQRAEVLATPMAQMNAVQLSSAARAILKAHGIQSLDVEPIGTSTASFVLVVNGKPLPNAYSTIHSVEQMYRIDATSEELKVYVTDRVRQGWEPTLVSYYIENELLKFDEAYRQEAHQHAQGPALGLPA